MIDRKKPDMVNRIGGITLKRKFICSLVILCLLLTVMASVVQAEESLDWDISLTAENVTSTGMTVVITAMGDSDRYELGFGNSYWVEVFRNDTWEAVPYINEANFNAILNCVIFSDSLTDEFDWEYMYGSLPAGEYRLAKEYQLYYSTEEWVGSTYYAYFQIAESHTCQDLDGDSRCDTCKQLQIPSAEQLPDWGITLTVERVTSTGMTLATTQCGGSAQGELEYDTCYSLQVFQNDQWVWVPKLSNTASFLETDQILLNNSTREQLNWERLYGELSPGRYRVVRELIHSTEDGDEEAWYTAEFIITDSHTCHSEDGDVVCDGCLAIVKHENVDANNDGRCELCGLWDEYRVVGDADWLGAWDPAYNPGRMLRQEGGSYKVVFRDVLPGNYEFKVTKNGTWDESWGCNGDNFCITVREKTDVIVIFTLRDGVGTIIAKAPATFDDVEEEEREESANTDDGSMLPTMLVLAVCIPSVCILLRRKKYF
jgi:hypothetical protein